MKPLNLLTESEIIMVIMILYGGIILQIGQPINVNYITNTIMGQGVPS